MDAWKYTPAQDLELSKNDRLKSAHREPGLVEVMIRNTWWWMFRGYLATCQRLIVHGRQNLPATAPMILIANHQSHLDALVIASALPRQLRNNVFPIAAGDHFFETPAARIFAATAMNALPLWRKNAGRHAMEQLRHRLLSEPCGYILFPEGTRSRTGQLNPFRAGIGMLIAGTPVPVIPCHLAGTFTALPPDARLPKRSTIHLKIGAPLTFQHLENTRDSWDQIASQLQSAVQSLAKA